MKGENMNSLQVFEKDISFHTMDKQELADYVAAFAAEMEGRSVQRQVATKIINEPAPVKTGVYFRVQILATSKSVDAERYFSKLKLGRIFKEYIEGLYKYTTGTFTYYKDAKYFIDKLGRVNLNEAFVIAYQDGERIPVRKALRLTNQKWIK
jgi:N-acetylmuramoyl-L-alanine amidase